MAPAYLQASSTSERPLERDNSPKINKYSYGVSEIGVHVASFTELLLTLELL